MADWTDALTRAEQREFQAWARHQAEEVLPAMEDSAVVMSIAPMGKPDSKFCVELGFALMLGKPVILLVDKRAAPIPGKLRQVADEIVEVDLASDDPAVAAADRERVGAALARLREGR